MQVTTGKRERTVTVGHHLSCSISEEGQEVSPSKQRWAKGFQEVERRQHFYDCWLKNCSLVAATSTGTEA